MKEYKTTLVVGDKNTNEYIPELVKSFSELISHLVISKIDDLVYSNSGNIGKSEIIDKALQETSQMIEQQAGEYANKIKQKNEAYINPFLRTNVETIRMPLIIFERSAVLVVDTINNIEITSILTAKNHLNENDFKNIYKALNDIFTKALCSMDIRSSIVPNAIYALGYIYQANKQLLSEYNYKGFWAYCNLANAIELMGTNVFIEKIEFDECEFTNELFDNFLKNLCLNPNLKSLHLQQTNLDFSETNNILKALRENNNTIEDILIIPSTPLHSFKEIQNEVAELLKSSTTVRNIITTDISTIEENRNFFEAVNENNSLRVLVPQGGDEEETEISELLINTLKTKTNILDFDLSSFDISNQSISDLISSLATNTSLIKVFFNNNDGPSTLTLDHQKALSKSILTNNNILKVKFDSEPTKDQQKIHNLIKAKTDSNNKEADRLVELVKAKEKPVIQISDFHELLERRAAVKYKLENECGETEEKAEKLIEDTLNIARKKSLLNLRILKNRTEENPFAIFPDNISAHLGSYKIFDEMAHRNLTKFKELSIKYLEFIDKGDIPNLNKCLARMNHYKFDEFKEKSIDYTNIINKPEIGKIIKENLRVVKNQRELSASTSHAEDIEASRKRKKESTSDISM